MNESYARACSGKDQIQVEKARKSAAAASFIYCPKQ